MPSESVPPTPEFPVFDPAALDANRRGEFTAAQRQAIAARRDALNLRGPGLLFLFLLLLLAIVYALAAMNPKVPEDITLLIGCAGSALMLATGGAGAVLGLLFFRRTLQAVRLRQELNDPRIEQDVGWVAPPPAYEAPQTPDQTLETLPGTPDLPAGHYRFFFLARTGLLLSAEPLDPHAPDFDLLGMLARAHSFKLIGVEANRSGRLGPGQMHRLARSAALHTVAGLALVGAALGLLLGYAAEARWRDGGVGLCLLVNAPFGGGVGVYLLRQAFRRWREARASQVLSVQGPVEKKRVAGRTPTYVFVAGGQEFQVPYKTFQALPEGRPYRLYYTPQSKIVVAIEPMAVKG